MHRLQTLPITLKILRELDSIVDFSRSTNQLIIIFYLSTISDFVSLSTISYELGVSRKVILDSIRKLEKKNLVNRIVKKDDIYFTLSSKGRDYVSKLFTLLKGEQKIEKKEVLSVATRLNLGHELITAYRIYRALVALGLSDNEYMSLYELALHMGLSPERAKSYLDSFSTSPSRLFRRVTRQNKVYYRLDKDGYNILHKTSHYLNFRRQRTYRFLVKFFKTPWPDHILKKVNLLQLIVLPIAIIVCNLFLDQLIKFYIEISIIILWISINIILFIKLK